MGFLSKVLLPMIFVSLATICGVWATWQILIHGPEIVDMTVRSRVESSVVYITNIDRNTIGTGFKIQNSNGKSFILTNRHVCEGGKNFSLRLLDLFEYKTKVVKLSLKYDLCLMTAPKNMDSLNVTGNFYWGQTVFVTGHPSGYKFHVSEGKAVDVITWATTFDIGTFSEKECKSADGWVRDEISPGFLTPRVNRECEMQREYIVISALTEGGNSGSPVVTLYGDVIGIISMRDNNHWGMAVPFSNIKEFLEEQK